MVATRENSTTSRAAHDAAPESSDVVAPRWLVPASVTYMALPTLIFVIGWTRPLIALVAGIATVAVVVASVRDARSRAVRRLPRRTTAAIWIWSTAVGLVSGAGGFIPQSWDWLKHNAILRDLVVERWPVAYDIEGETFQLTYYLGYYLPAAALGKIAGWPVANLALLVWTILGVGLALTWFMVLTSAGTRAGVIVIAVLFSGLDVVGRLLFAPVAGMDNLILPSNQLDWWAMIGKYPNHITSVMWGPHHALGAWVGAALILHLARTNRVRWIIPVVAYCGLFSPFVTLGLLPVVAYAVLRDGRASALQHLRSLASAPAALACVGVAPVLAYYAAIAAPLPDPYNGSVTAGFALTDPIQPLNLQQALIAYLMLILLEVIVFYILVSRSSVGREPDNRRLLATITATMVLLPLFRYGAWSDLAMRAVVPSMFLMAVLVGRVVLESPRRSFAKIALIVVLVLGVVAPAGEISRALNNNHWRGDFITSRVDRGSAEASDGIVVLSESVYATTPRFLAQYNAPTDTFFSRTIARRG